MKMAKKSDYGYILLFRVKKKHMNLWMMFATHILLKILLI